MFKTVDENSDSVDAGSRTVVVLKGTTAYLKWVAQLARVTRIPAPNLFDIALAEWARRQGHIEPPSRLGK
jgi:hypothetical protein